MRAIVFAAALAVASAGVVGDWSLHDPKPSDHLGNDERYHHRFETLPGHRARDPSEAGPWAGYAGNQTHTASGAHQFFPPPTSNRLVGAGLDWDTGASWTIGRPAHHPDLNPIINYDITFDTTDPDGFSEGSVVDIKGSKLTIRGARFIVGETNRKCSIECALTYNHDTSIGHFQITHDSTSRHTHHYCFKVGCNAWDVVGCSCQCKCCDDLNQPADYCAEIPTNYDEEGPVGPTITSHPTPAPTPEPTPEPTSSPTHTHCDPNTDTHQCWEHPVDPSIYATCVPANGNGVDYDCICPTEWYEIVPHSGHDVHPAHKCDTAAPTSTPTAAPTASPTCGADWQQMGDDIDGEAAFDTLGMRNSVDMSSDGHILAVGSNENDGNGRNSGHVRAFEWTGSEWTQMGPDIEGNSAWEFAGSAVDLSADGYTMGVGAHARGTTHGRVRVYTWNKANKKWVQKGTDLIGEEKYDFAGAVLDMSANGDMVAVGAYKNSGGGGHGNGHVRVYTWTGLDWKQIGSDIDGEEIYGQAGISVDLSASGTRLAVGAHENSVENTKYHAGHVRVYEFDTATRDWKQMGNDINGESQFDYSGSAIDLNDAGDVLAVGAYKNDGAGTDAGHVRAYHWTGHNWAQMGADIDGHAAYDNFGVSVDLASDGHTMAVGAWGNDAAGSNAGHARMYTWDGLKWTQKGKAITGDHAWDHSGSSVDISADGHTLAVGARYHSPTADKKMAGQVKVYSTCAHLTDFNSGKGTQYTDTAKTFSNPMKQRNGVNYLFNDQTPSNYICRQMNCASAAGTPKTSTGQVCKIWYGGNLVDVGCGTTKSYVHSLRCDGCSATGYPNKSGSAFAP